MSSSLPCVRAGLLVLAWMTATARGLTRPDHHALENPPVIVTGGLIKGSCNAAGICSYLGIPYAAPPVGDLRWAPPQPPARWPGVRDATRPGAICPQHAVVPFSDLPHDESCLFLNVWAPKGACPEASCPVMFWIHGGAYSEGSGLDVNGTTFVEMARNVVVVTINYRLGFLGFAGAEALRSRDPLGSTGNYGIQDQRFAMEWVQQNIHRFGGDKNNVLIFGQSAGSASVANHMVNNRSRHLYHKAIMESGPLAFWSARPMSQAEEQFAGVASAAKCDKGGDAVKCLAAMDAGELLNISIMAWGAGYGKYGEPFGAPTVDGVEMSQFPWESMRQGKFNKEVPVMIGVNKDEGTTGMAQLAREKGYDLTEHDFKTLVASAYGPEHVQDILDVYRVGSEPEYTNWYWSYTHVHGDPGQQCPTRRLARAICKWSKVFVYYYAHTPRGTPPAVSWVPGVNGSGGAFHAAELQFVWQLQHNSTQWPCMMSDDELQLARNMSAYWLNFAVHSDPNSAAGGMRTEVSQQWPKYSCSEGKVLTFDLPSLRATAMPFKRQCDMIDALDLP